jgi:hypothetical protein
LPLLSSGGKRVKVSHINALRLNFPPFTFHHCFLIKKIKQKKINYFFFRWQKWKAKALQPTPPLRYSVFLGGKLVERRWKAVESKKITVKS